MKRKFIPFTQVKNQPAIIVDSLHPNGFVLSHWRGAPTPAAVRGDTSADMVLNALKTPDINLDFEFATANHFDIDGFVGVWALLEPELALAYEAVLRQMALIGDFRELDLNQPAADLALKLVCWINARETELFYPPFGADETPESEVVASVPKFNYFLREFTRVLLQPESEKAIWAPEYQQVLEDYAVIWRDNTQVKTYPALGLVVVQTPAPVHYYALFSRTAGYDIVLAQYSQNRYELECKYTTWVDIESRSTLPRVALAPLAAQLNKHETAPYRWTAEPVTDTGPILRLAGTTLTKQERYANPTSRPIYASGLAPGQLEGAVVNYLKNAYQLVTPRKYWTWAEVKDWNNNRVAKADIG